MISEPLGGLAERIDYGLTASARDVGGPRFLRITDIQGGTVNWSTVPGCNASGDLGQFSLRPGDVVFARTGGTTGKSFLLRECPDCAVFASYLIRVRPGPRVNPLYLSYFFDSPAYWRHIASSSNGSAQPGVNASKLRELLVPVPPLSEQRRIADILDGADALGRKRREVLRRLDDLLRSVFLETFGDPVRNPRGWPLIRLSDVVSAVEPGWSSNSLDHPADDTEWGVLKVSAVSTGLFLEAENKAVASPTFLKAPVTPRRGDLLFSRANTRDLVAATCLVTEDAPLRFLPDKLWRISCQPNLATVEWLRFLLANPAYRATLTKQATGTSGSMLNVSQEKLLALVAPVPPLARQREFAAIVWETMAHRARVLAGCRASEKLFSSLVDHAFNGDL